MTTDTRQMRLGLPGDRRTIDDRFNRFHAAHPDVYAALCELARALVAKGYRHLGIDWLWGTLRYQRAMATLPDAEEGWYLNDHFRSRYARLLMAQEPDLAGIFEERGLRAR